MLNERVNVDLIAKTYTVDPIGQRVAVESRRTISGWVDSTNAAEFDSAGEAGFRRDRRVTVWSFEYEGENEIELGGVRYRIYRTYSNRQGKVELYLEKRVGV